MKLLLDAHLLLWAAGGSSRLSREARALLENADNILHFSAASIWEVSMKASAGRADFVVDPRQLRRGLLVNGYSEIPVTGEHALELSNLAAHHRDPFDRILLCQARVEGLVLLTSDAGLAAYGAPAKLV